MLDRYDIFQSTLPGWGATEGIVVSENHRRISIHAPRMGSDHAIVGRDLGRGISIHAPRMGSDAHTSESSVKRALFQSTLPGWGATRCPSAWCPRRRYFNPRSPDGERPMRSGGHALTCLISIHAPRMGSDTRSPGSGRTSPISIHAPRMGSDPRLPGRLGHARVISIHAPRMGSDPLVLAQNAGVTQFQSTLPGWGATLASPSRTRRPFHFNPRSPDGERPRSGIKPLSTILFQSTLPGWGATWSTREMLDRYDIFQSTLPGWGATGPDKSRSPGSQFQSTLPGWGATLSGRVVDVGGGISIHAPRMGSDLRRTCLAVEHADFNPRSPDGERREIYRATAQMLKFQSTLPGWGATGGDLAFGHGVAISIHAPRMGSDAIASCAPLLTITFQSTLPGWGATQAGSLAPPQSAISIHAPRMGSDAGRKPRPTSVRNFNPRSPDGERRSPCTPLRPVNAFQSTLPGWGATDDGREFLAVLDISIHAPRMGSDLARHERAPRIRISIHAPRMGSDRVAIRL